MEGNDREEILRHMEDNAELRRLYEEHQALQEKLAAFESRPFLTAEEEGEEKRLKLKKLRGVDRMMQILAASKSGQPTAESPQMCA